MTAGQFEEDLYHKVTAANEEYRVKAVAAQQLREKFVSELRPAAVYELRLLTEELDDILKTKMEQLAIQQEMLIWNDEAVINPAMRGVAGTSLRGKIAQIDNNADFRSDILDLSGNVMRLLSRKQTR
ncbi:hypothetical protein GQ44DRAFT_702608 [Phaeosphaeriaceae sp. PMI808]|nr:hypothetical protein GQ44DRAFT_702608 [Phaeosphaeriaceae sp. PMI808]